MPAGSPGSLPGARVLLRPGLGHHDSENQSREDIAARRDDPGRANYRGNPDHDCLDAIGGDPAVGGGTGVGRAGAGWCVHRDRGGDPASINSHGRREQRSRDLAVMSANVSRTGVRRSWSPLGCCGTRLSAQVGYPNSTALLPAGGHPPGGVSFTPWMTSALSMASGKHVGKLLRGRCSPAGRGGGTAHVHGGQDILRSRADNDERGHHVRSGRSPAACRTCQTLEAAIGWPSLMNSPCTRRWPRWVLRCHTDHELSDRGCRGRPARTPAGGVVPFWCDKAPVPGEQRHWGRREHLAPSAPGDQPA
jgi:hypothetical protein